MTFKNLNDVEYDYLFKILIIGDCGVGKSTILQRFAQDYFSTEYVATIGVDFQIRTIDIDSKRCKLQVWDTAGQDRFKCVVNTFYRNANGVVICFDLTELDTFRNITKWHEEVKRYCADDTPVILIGTKSDLKMQRVVSDEMIKTFSETNGLSYVETSSKTNQNVEKSFSDLTRTLITHTNQIELKQKKEKSTTNVDLRSKPVTNSSNSGGCWGANKCII